MAKSLKGRTAVKRSYHTINKQGKANERKLADFLSKGGQLLLPMVDLIEQCRLACDELIDVAGRATIQAVLELSAEQAAGGPRQQGKQRSGEVVWYGVSRLSWKWRRRPSVKINGETREKGSKELHRRAKGRHSEGAFVRESSDLGPVRKAWDASDDVLPLAKRLV